MGSGLYSLLGRKGEDSRTANLRKQFDPVESLLRKLVEKDNSFEMSSDLLKLISELEDSLDNEKNSLLLDELFSNLSVLFLRALAEHREGDEANDIVKSIESALKVALEDIIYRRSIDHSFS